MGKKLYVGNLSLDVSDEQLEQAFSEYGLNMERLLPQ